jgi:hypothetical protein
MAEAAHIFDTLREWEALSDEELRARFNAEATVVITSAAALLMDEPVSPERLAPANFPEAVRELNNLLISGSRALGDAIIKAGELADTGHKRQAADIYAAFLNSCRSPFYRRIARSRLERLGNVDG